MSNQDEKNKKLNINEEKQNTDKVDEDLIVHNMPSHDQIEGELPATKDDNRFLSDNNNSESGKLTGILIIVLGIILILALIYLGYRFIIKNPISPNQVNPIVDNRDLSEEIEPSEQEEDLDLDSVEIDDFSDLDLNESEEINLDDDLNSELGEEDYLFPEEGLILEEYVWTPLIDSDSDGLSNEEEATLGTDPDNPDSDGDGFSDLEELLNLYDPIGPGHLEENRYISRFNNNNLNYSLLYPQAWNLELEDSGYLAVLNMPDNSIVQISVSENLQGHEISRWYETLISSEPISSEKMINGDNWQGIQDTFYFYATDEAHQYIYTISYIPVIPERLTYKNIFQMIINSFELN